MKYFILLGLLAQFAFAACRCQKNALLSNRYSHLSASHDFSGDSSLIDVKALVGIQPDVDTVKSNTKTIFDLKGEGQKELLSIFSQKDTSAQQRVTALLNQEFQTPEVSADIDNSQPSLSIILSVALRDFYQNISPLWSPGDRIQSLRISIALPKESRDYLEFKSWNKVQTQYASYAAAGVSYSKSKAWNISPSVGIAGSTFSLGSYNVANGDSATDSLKYSVVVMTGTLTPDSVSIQEEGSPTQSLFGNTALLVTPEYKYVVPSPRLEFDGLINDKGVFQDPSKVKVKEHLVLYPQVPKEGIVANMELYYEIRHITKNAETIPEGDDEIQFFTGHKTWPVTFIHWEDVTPPVRDIQNNGSRLGLWDESTNETYEIDFDSYKAARNFYDWLYKIAPTTDQAIKIGNYKITASYDFIAKKPVFLTKFNFDKKTFRIQTERY